MSELITVPTFTFRQGDLFNSDIESERPINVDFYNGSIVLRQDGAYAEQEQVIILPSMVKALFKEILKHQKNAEWHLNKK